MSLNLDKPLDDLIASNPKARRGGNRRGGAGGRGGARARSGGAKGAALGGVAQNAAVVAAATSRNRNRPPVVIPGRGAGRDTGSKIIVSNLPFDVTEAQVKELFSTTIGPLRKIVMSYKSNGQSTGVCNVEFQRRDDANRAYQQYNNRLIDQKRPLKVEMVVDPAQAAAQVAQQVVVAPAAPKAANGAARGGAGARGRGARRGRGGATRQSRPKKTAEDLDAEMEDYANQASGEPAAPAS